MGDDDRGERRPPAGAAGEPRGGAPLRVLVVASDTAVAAALADVRGITVVGAASSIEGAQKWCRRGGFGLVHLVLLEGALVRGVEAEVVEQLTRGNTTKVVLMEPTASAHRMRAALEAGSRGLVDPAGDPETLLRTLRAAAHGMTSVDADTLRRIMRVAPPPRRPAEGVRLSVRERQVLTLLAEGSDTATIAAELFLAASTIRNHIHRIELKLGARSRDEAVRMGRAAGVIDP